MKKETTIIKSRKFDGKIHRTWEMDFIDRQNSLLKFVGKFEKEIFHQHLGVIRPKTISYEFYWLDRWYNVFRFHEPDGELRNFYCNLNMPPTFENGILDYIDLDIDILVWKDFSYQILDLDEFDENALRYSYPKDLRVKTEMVLEELVSLIEHKTFPFDYKF